MKNFKNGFSLAELLIALAIISIISVMGFNITKKSTEKAYNLYIFAGYEAMQNALLNTEKKNYTIEDCKDGNLSGVETTCDFVKRIQKLLSVSPEDIDESDKYFASFTTFNNIKYVMNYSDENDGCLLIKMSVPTSKKKINNTVISAYTFSFIYAPNKFSYLIPSTQKNDNGTNDTTATSTPTNHIDLSRRVDLLPFYIDDGVSGRVIQYYDSNSGTFKPKKKFKPHDYYSFYEAFTRNNQPENYTFTWDSTEIIKIDTRNNSNANTSSDGIMKIANPRKVF